jgi:hypothetical protein
MGLTADDYVGDRSSGKNAYYRDERKTIMTIMKKRLAALSFAIGVVAMASPSLAQRHDRSDSGVGAARAEALRECNARARPFLDKDWGENQSDIYRACMAEHGQPE